MKLTDAQHEKLTWLHKHGGSGYLDKHGRVVAGGDHMPQGCWPAWLNLVAHGLIAGGDGRLTVTEYGRQHAEPQKALARIDALETPNGEVRGASRLAGEVSSAEGATSTVVLEGKGERK